MFEKYQKITPCGTCWTKPEDRFTNESFQDMKKKERSSVGVVAVASAQGMEEKKESVEDKRAEEKKKEIAEEEKKRLDKLKQAEEENKKRLEELKQAEEEKKRLEELKRAEEEKKRLDNLKRAEDEKKRLQELKQAEEEKKRLDKLKQAEEEKKKQREERKRVSVERESDLRIVSGQSKVSIRIFKKEFFTQNPSAFVMICLRRRQWPCPRALWTRREVRRLPSAKRKSLMTTTNAN